MKRLAEKIEDRSFEDHEVSSYYIKKAFAHILNNPIKEIQIAGKKAIATINDYEATTYVNFYFQRELSPVLSYSITFGILFPFAALGLIFHYRRYMLLMPPVASFLTILMFFYLARLRMPMIPMFAIFAAGAMATITSYIKIGSWNRVILSCIFLVGIYILSNWSLAKIDTSNEWNKVGVILRIQKRYADAERAFSRAMRPVGGK